MLYKIHIFQCMGGIFCVEFQMYPYDFYTTMKFLELLDLRVHMRF